MRGNKNKRGDGMEGVGKLVYPHSSHPPLRRFCEINVMADISVWEDPSCLVFPYQSRHS